MCTSCSVSLACHPPRPFQPVPALRKRTTWLRIDEAVPLGNSWKPAASFSSNSCGPCYHTHTHTTSSHIPLSSLLRSRIPPPPPPSPPLSLPLSPCPWLWLALPLSKAVVTVRLPHIIPPRWKLNEGGLTQLTEACFEGCNRGRLLCQILFHGLWICAAEARTQQSLSHAEAQTTGLISPPDLWKLHFFFFF